MTVYAVQNPIWRHEGQYKPKFDLAPAAEFGEICELLSPSAKPFFPDPIIKQLYEKLADFSDDDYIICIGNPILMSMAFSIAADINDGRVKLLQWHGYDLEYQPVQIDLGFTDQNESDISEA